MRLTKEDKVIQNSKNIHKELCDIFSDGMAPKEYNKLKNEYVRLSKRYQKSVKQADKMGNSLIYENDELSDKIDFTIQIAKKNIMNKVVENRKTKDTLVEKQDHIEKLYEKIAELILENNELKSKINTFTKNI